MGQDTRKDPRAKVLSLNVRYKSATVDEFIEHHSHDISKGGIFIKTPSPFPAGTLLKFEIRIREDQPLIAGVGRVVWKREPPQAGAERPAGMGVKFIKLDGHSRELIDRIVAERKDDGPVFEETPDGRSPSMAPPPASASAPANTASGSGGGNFFPSGPPAEQPPAAERTVIKQADEILADALKGAGLGDVGATPPPIEMPRAPAGGAPARKQTLLGMPSAPGAAFKLPDDVAAAAREFENKIKSESPPDANKEEHAPKAVSASEPPTAKEPATRSISDRPGAKISSVPPPIPKNERPVAAAAALSESRRPPPLAQAAAPAPAQKGGGAVGWLVVLLLVGAAGAGGYYLMTKGNDAPTPPPTTAPTPPPPVASPSVSAIPTETAAPSVTAPPPPSVEPSTSASVAPSPSPSPSPASSPAPSPSPKVAPPPPPPTTAAPPPPPPPTAKPPPPPPTAKPPPPPPPPTAKPPPKPKPTDDNPYQ